MKPRNVSPTPSERVNTTCEWLEAPPPNVGDDLAPLVGRLERIAMSGSSMRAQIALQRLAKIYYELGLQKGRSLKGQSRVLKRVLDLERNFALATRSIRVETLLKRRPNRRTELPALLSENPAATTTLLKELRVGRKEFENALSNPEVKEKLNTQGPSKAADLLIGLLSGVSPSTVSRARMHLSESAIGDLDIRDKEKSQLLKDLKDRLAALPNK